MNGVGGWIYPLVVARRKLVDKKLLVAFERFGRLYDRLAHGCVEAKARLDDHHASNRVVDTVREALLKVHGACIHGILEVL